MKIFRELLQLIGIIFAAIGLLICMCECNEMSLQIRTLAIGNVVFLIGVLVTYVGSQLPESVKK